MIIKLHTVQLITIVAILCSFSTFTSCQQNNYNQGKRIYASTCANCHMDDGKGLGTLFPPINGADYLKEDFLRIICTIKDGIKGKLIVNGVEFDSEMPAHTKLSEAELSNLINYINHEWFDHKNPIGIKSIRDRLSTCEN